MAILPLAVGVGILLYLGWLIIQLIRDWVQIVGQTISSGEKKGETSGQIVLDVGKVAAIGAAKVAVGYAIGAALGEAAGAGSRTAGGATAGGGAFGGGGAAGSW